MTIVAGVDGGATHTRLILLDEAGNVLGMGQSGPSNLDNISNSFLVKNLSDALEKACSQNHIDFSQIDALFLGMAGVVCETDKKVIRHAVDQLPLKKKISVDIDHDIRIALAGGLAGKAEGIAVIAGTGSSCYGRNKQGQSWMSGGWGHLLDDYGSGYDIGLNAIKSVLRSYDGRSTKTSMTKPLLDKLKINSIPDIMNTVYYGGVNQSGHPMTKEEIAALAPIVFEEANHNDDAALSILNSGTTALAQMIKAVMKSLDLKPKSTSITYTGGILLNYLRYRDLLSEKLDMLIPGSSLTQPQFEPVIGAGLLGLLLLDIPMNQQIIDSLKSFLVNT